MDIRRLILLFASAASCLSLFSCAPATNPGSTIPASTVIAETGDTQWDMVIFGDSDMWYSYEYYSKYFEQDLGISIVINNETRMAMPSTSWLSTLRDNQNLRDQISKAEIIAFNVPLVFPMMGGACFDWTTKLEDGCFSESPDLYAKNTRQIIRQIKALVGKRGAMIRLQNGYVPVDWWRANEYLKDRAGACLACFARYWQVESKVAAEEGIPIVDVFTAFHGANHDKNPAEAGLIGDDGIHVSEAGAKAEADLYRKLGYAWWKP